MPWTVSVNRVPSARPHAGGSGCCSVCDGRRTNDMSILDFLKKNSLLTALDEVDPITTEQYAAGAVPEVGAPPIPMRNERVDGVHELSGSGYELYVNPTTLQLVEMLKRSSKNVANINVYSRRDIAAAISEDMKHAEIHEAMVTHAHPLATQDRRRLILDEGIGRWRVVGQAGVPLQVLNAEGRVVDRAFWPAALLAAIPEGMIIDGKSENFAYLDAEFPPVDWTEREIRNALEEQVQLQQSTMYFGDPELTNSLMEERLESNHEEEE